MTDSSRHHSNAFNLLWGASLFTLLWGAKDVQAQSAAPPISPATVAEGPQEAHPASPTDPRVADLVQKLDDDRYAVRQAAQRELHEIGAPALKLTAQAAADGTLESSTRAVNILLDWIDSKDPELSLAALEIVAGLTKRPIESAIAKDRLAIIREAVAIEAIRSLGGVVENDRGYGVGVIGGPNAPKQIVLSDEWKGGVEGLKHIGDVRTATTLSLWSAPLDDAALPQLGGFTNLRRIELYGLALTPELVDKTREKLPNTIVEVRGGARLGIRGLDSQEVLPNSPAAKAGLIPHDVVKEFAGVEINTFEDLTAQISKCKPGDTVDIKIMRGEQIIDKQVTFDRWGDDVASATSPPVPPVNQQGLFGRIPAPAPAPQPIVDPTRLVDPTRR